MYPDIPEPGVQLSHSFFSVRESEEGEIQRPLGVETLVSCMVHILHEMYNTVRKYCACMFIHACAKSTVYECISCKKCTHYNYTCTHAYTILYMFLYTRIKMYMQIQTLNVYTHSDYAPVLQSPMLRSEPAALLQRTSVCRDLVHSASPQYRCPVFAPFSPPRGL